MSLGLASADTDAIYLAAESEGLQSNVINSKLRKLQDEPVIAIVVAGGLEHWKHVFDSYTSQPSVDAACKEVVRLLDENMAPANQAYGILCGYEGDNPICCRIDRSVGANATCRCKRPLVDVEVIGHCYHTKEARDRAKIEISNGTAHEQALREAILSRIPGQYVRCPVETMVIKRAEPGATADALRRD